MNSRFATKTGNRFSFTLLLSLTWLLFSTDIDFGLAQEKSFAAPFAKNALPVARLEKLTSFKKFSAANNLSSRINADEVEPNNDEDAAQPLSGNSPLTVNGNAETSDAGRYSIEYEGGVLDDIEDLYKLTIFQPGLKINLGGNQSDIDMFLFPSPIAPPIDGSNSTGTGGEEIDQPALAAGTYLIGVSIYDPDPIGPDASPYVLTVTLTPLAGSHIGLDPSSKNFGFVEIGASSAPATFSIQSIGNAMLTVTNISSSDPVFSLAGVPALPLNLAPGADATFTATFSPAAAGPDTGAITITSNDADGSPFNIEVIGNGFLAARAIPGQLYGSSGNSDGGRFFTIDRASGAATLIGATGFDAVAGLAINSLGEIFASTASTPSLLVKIDAETGEGFPIGNLGFDYIEALAFDSNDTLYGADAEGNGGLYLIDPITAQATVIGSTGVDFISGLSFSLDGVLFASNGQGGGLGPGDQLYTIDTSSAAATLVGDIGFDASIPDIAFDGNGNLFGLTGGQGANTRRLISINPTTGAGTVVGPLGFNAMSGLCFAPGVLNDVENGEAGGPLDFALAQNYPNPFNPSTKLRYSIVRASHVVLKIYSVLGQEVRTVVDERQTANSYETFWDGRNDGGTLMPSGMYFYQLRADGRVETRRMLFLK